MYFCVAKLSFDVDERTPYDDKELKALCEKIRARLRISAQVDFDTPAIAIAFTKLSEEKINHVLDQLENLCEMSGFGRIENEQFLVDHIDNLGT